MINERTLYLQRGNIIVDITFLGVMNRQNIMYQIYGEILQEWIE